MGPEMPGSLKGDQYREEAKRVRELARITVASDIRKQLERVALDYEQLAEMTDRPATGLD